MNSEVATNQQPSIPGIFKRNNPPDLIAGANLLHSCTVTFKIPGPLASGSYPSFPKHVRKIDVNYQAFHTESSTESMLDAKSTSSPFFASS